MTLEEMAEDIKIELGAPIVNVENESIIPSLINKSLREVSPYITETHFITVPYSTNGIDVSKYNISSIVQIFRTQNPSRVADFTDIYSLSSLNTAYTSSTNLLMSDYLYRTQMNQLKSTITTDLDFTYDKDAQVLYINTFYPRPDRVTIAYIPVFNDVSELRDLYWINKVLRLAIALCKISLGHIRGKYELSSSLYKLNGDQMVSEGISERDAVRQELIDNADLAFPID